jgi:hypothetical protein
MVFSKAKLIQEGGDNIDDYVTIIRDAILAKEGLVSEEASQEFKFFVQNCMSTSILDQIGGEMNSFNKKSFRLKQLNNSRSSLSFKQNQVPE